MAVALAQAVQTAFAALETIKAVGIPQAPTTHPRAEFTIAEEAEGAHWQAKSVEAQPSAEAAEVMHAC